jgi:hypothetical protein
VCKCTPSNLCNKYTSDNVSYRGICTVVDQCDTRAYSALMQPLNSVSRQSQRSGWQQINGIHGCFLPSELWSVSLLRSLAGECHCWSTEPYLGDPDLAGKLSFLDTRRRNDNTRSLALGLFTLFSALASARRTFRGTRILPEFNRTPVTAISSL